MLSHDVIIVMYNCMICDIEFGHIMAALIICTYSFTQQPIHCLGHPLKDRSMGRRVYIVLVP